MTADPKPALGQQPKRAPDFRDGPTPGASHPTDKWDDDPAGQELREALDDLWGCIAKPEIDHLQPETVRVAQANHELLWHSDEAVPWWAIWRRRLPS